MSGQHVPFLPLTRVNDRYTQEARERIAQVLDRGWYLLGNELREFESAWADTCQVRNAVGTGSGIDAIQLILEGFRCLKLVEVGDEVLVPAQTFFATYLAVARAGLVPVPVDVCPRTSLMLSDDAADALSSRTKVIMPVHLYGAVAEMGPLRELADRHKLLIVEDAAQAHGAADATGRPVGSLGDAAAFSFYPGKNLGCLGDGGAVTTDNEELADTVRQLRNYGMREKYDHRWPGMNSRLDEIQSAFLNIKLKSLRWISSERQKVAERYRNEIVSSQLELPPARPDTVEAWHLFVVRAQNRDNVRNRLESMGIETSIHYPRIPLRQDGCDVVRIRSVTNAEHQASCCLSLPCHECMTEPEVAAVIAAVNSL